MEASVWSSYPGIDYTLTVDLAVTNHGAEVTVDGYAAVELAGGFYFYPQFTSNVHTFISGVTLPAGLVVPRFELLRLPFGAPLGTRVPLTWYVVFLDSGTGRLHSEVVVSRVELW